MREINIVFLIMFFLLFVFLSVFNHLYIQQIKKTRDIFNIGIPHVIEKIIRIEAIISTCVAIITTIFLIKDFL